MAKAMLNQLPPLLLPILEIEATIIRNPSLGKKFCSTGFFRDRMRKNPKKTKTVPPIPIQADVENSSTKRFQEFASLEIFR